LLSLSIDLPSIFSHPGATFEFLSEAVHCSQGILLEVLSQENTYFYVNKEKISLKSKTSVSAFTVIVIAVMIL
jgi:hypothetical protein